MLNRIMRQMRGARSWVLNPGCLIDRFLDHLDKLNAFVLPTDAGTPSYRYVEVEARRRRVRE